jgi:hypothetical protein
MQPGPRLGQCCTASSLRLHPPRLQAWLAAARPELEELLGWLLRRSAARMARLAAAASAAEEQLWWPFTQVEECVSAM